jgi:hypothetical protein
VPLGEEAWALLHQIKNGQALLTPIRTGIREGEMQEVLHKGKPPAAPVRLTGAGYGPALSVGQDFRGDENIVLTAGAIAGEGQEVEIER